MRTTTRNTPDTVARRLEVSGRGGARAWRRRARGVFFRRWREGGGREGGGGVFSERRGRGGGGDGGGGVARGVEGCIFIASAAGGSGGGGGRVGRGRGRALPAVLGR